MKYYKNTQILKEKESDIIVDEVIGYVRSESLELLKEFEEKNRDLIPLYQLFDVQNIYEECSKEEYDNYVDSRISIDDLKNKNVQ